MLRDRGQSVEDAAEAHHLRVLRMGKLHLDDLNAEQRAIHIRLRQILAAGEFFFRTDAGGTRHIHIDHALVLRVGDQRVRVRSTAGLNILHLLGVRRIADVIDAHAHHAVGADLVRHTLRAAIRPVACAFRRHEEEIPPHRRIALSRAAHFHRGQRRLRRVRHVPDLEPAEVSLIHIWRLEGEIRVRKGQPTRATVAIELGRLRRGRDKLQSFDRRSRIIQAGLEADARIRCGCRLRSSRRGDRLHTLRCERTRQHHRSGSHPGETVKTVQRTPQCVVVPCIAVNIFCIRSISPRWSASTPVAYPKISGP